MFEAMRSSTPPSVADVIIAANPGFGVLYFAPKPEQKPAASLVTEMAREVLPVTCWRLRNGTTEPMTFRDPPAGAARYLVIGQKFFALDGTSRSWANYDLFAEHLIQTWRSQRREAEPKPQQPVPAHAVSFPADEAKVTVPVFSA
jgi:hypothetical protein